MDQKSGHGFEAHQSLLTTGGGRIRCLRCTARSTRTKLQCGRPALKASTTQKCQFHGGRPHSEQTLQCIAEANTIHGKFTKKAKEKRSRDSSLVHELEDAVAFLEMGVGPRVRGRKPEGYKPVLSDDDVLRMIQERLLQMV
jgi:hypothetical protein